MRKVLIQRVSALALCAVGGAALFLSPAQLGDAGTQVDQRTPSASATTVTSTTPPGTASSEASRLVSAPPTTPSPSLHADRTLPTPIRNLHLSGNTARTYTVAWRSSFDAAGIRHYVVLANGFLVGRTPVPSITLLWPNSEHRILVQVAAVDGNGLQGEWRALMIVPPPVVVPSTTPSLPTPTRSQSPSSIGHTGSPSSPPPTQQHSPRPSPSASPSLDPCSTEDQTPTATATNSPEPTTSAGPSLSPSAPPSSSSAPSASLSTEPGTPTGDPSDVPSC